MLTLATKTAVPILAATNLFYRLAGMTYKVERKQAYTTNANGDPVFKTQTFPVSANVNVAECWEQGRYKDLVPDTSIKSLGYFESLQTVSRASNAPRLKNNLITYEGVLRFIYVANIAKMNFNDSLGNDSNVDAVFETAIINALHGQNLAVNDAVFTGCRVDFKMRGDVKKDHRTVFPYTYENMNLSVLGLYPMTFGAIDFDVTLWISRACVQSITAGTALDCKII